MRAAVFLLALVASALADDSPAPTPRAERGPDFGRRVHEAIRRGVAWLRTKQVADGLFSESADGSAWSGWGGGWGTGGGYVGHWGGTWSVSTRYGNVAPVYVTLRACRVPNEDPCVRRAWDALHLAAKDLRGTSKELERLRMSQAFDTGAMALALIAIESHGERVDPADDQSTVRLSNDDATWVAEFVTSLVALQHEDGGWRGDESAMGGRLLYPRAPDVHGYTHGVLLGLDAAARCGIAVDPAVWKKALDHLVAAQEPFGPSVRRGTPGDVADARTTRQIPVDRARGWGWTHGNPDDTRARVWSTGCGVASVAICRRRLAGRPEMTKKLDADSSRAVWDGLAWIGRNWPVDLPVDLSPRVRARTLLYGGYPAPNGYESIFRPCVDVASAGVLARVERMADLDWYAYGAEPLLAMQARAGFWGSFYGEPTEDELKTANYKLIGHTCQALLFLGARAHRESHAVTPGNEVNFSGAATLAGPEFDAFVGTVIARLRHADDLDAFDRLLDGATSVGPRIVEPLLLRLDTPDAGDRAAAHDLLVHATGNDLGFDPDADAAVRADALAKWQAWWLSVKDRLAYDPATKRLVVK